MINGTTQRDDTPGGDAFSGMLAGATVLLAPVWVLGASFIAWIAYDQCNLPNDNGVACDKTLDYWLIVYQPALAVAGSVTALIAVRRVASRSSRGGGASSPGRPFAITVFLLGLWLLAVVVK